MPGIGSCKIVREAERGGSCRRHKMRIGDRGKIDEADAIPISWARGLGHGERHGGLADPARTDDRDEASFAELRREDADRVGSTYNPVRRRGQVIRRDGDRRGRRKQPLHGRDELVAASGNVDDVAGTVAAVAESLPQHRKMDAEVAFLDEGVGPDLPDQLVLDDQFAPRLDQRDQEIERPAAKPDRPVILKEQLLPRIEAEWPEGQALIVGRDDRI